MRYRSDIDGLRAIAVLLVLMFHAGINILPSGFIGVDIFFVISGFLITSIIYSAQKNNTLSISEFYIRRLWRLQPALIAVVLFTLLIAFLFYLPADFISYLREAKYTMLVTSNQYFSRATTAYAAPETNYLLLLHTWSLSIEWQWYLILPASMVLLYKYLSPKSLKIFTVAITLIMAGISLFLSQIYPDKSYYFLTSRIFEFLFGSCLVILNTESFKLKSRTATLLGGLSIAALLYCATRNDIVLGYPDYHAVIVVAASALLIFTGSSTHSVITRALSYPPLVFIGTLSYSLYLWHWPIFATGRYLGFSENAAFILICFTLTFALSWLSYRYVEKPFRRKHVSLLWSLALLILIPALIFIVLSSVAGKYQGFSWRFGSQFQHVASLLKEHTAPQRKYCIDDVSDINNTRCIFGDVNAPKKALLIGDSHANHFWNFFDVLAKDAHISVTTQATSSCLTLPGLFQFDWWYFKSAVYQKCHDDSEKYFENIRQGNFDYVILGEVWDDYVSDKIINHIDDKRSLALSQSRLEVATKKALEAIIAAGAKPVIIKQVYVMPDNYMHCFYDGVKLRKDYVENSCNTAFGEESANSWFSQLFDRLQTEYPELIVIDPKEVQCAGDTCKTEINGVPVYRDVGHITDYASYMLGEEYLRKFANPFK